VPNPLAALLERLRSQERGTAFVLALLVEALLILAVLSIGLYDPPKPPGVPSLVSVDVAAPPAPEQDQPKPELAQAKAPLQTPQETPPVPVPTVAPVQPAPPIIQISRSQMAELDISRVPRQPAPAAAPPKGTYGPVDTGVPGDSKRIGSAPNGQPMYAAAWYREPYDSELSGYLSTADGPGWALIACRTAPDYRVEDCVGLGEYPQGSRIERAVLAAAWQFKVRPPRVGGVSKIGEWVRIRIEYGVRRPGP
jgi:protein TonB